VIIDDKIFDDGTSAVFEEASVSQIFCRDNQG
jgi:hypothetical protein